MTRQLWNRLFGNRPSRPSRIDRRRRPGLEPLEDRCVPSTFRWIGPNGGGWSNAANWYNVDIPTNHSVPGAADTAQFNPAAGGANTASIQDIPNKIISALVIDSSYGSTLSISQNLTLRTGQSSQAGGTVDITARLNLQGIDVGYTWSGGLLSGPGIFDVGQYTTKMGTFRASFSIAGTGSVLNLATRLKNEGYTTWSSPSQLDLSNGATITNTAGSTFSITTDGTLSGGGGWLYIMPGAAMSKDFNAGGTDTGTTYLNLPTGNYGTFSDSFGKVEFGDVGSTFLNEGTVSVTAGGITFDGPVVQEAPAAGILIATTSQVTVNQQDMIVAAGLVGGSPTAAGSLSINGNLYVMGSGIVSPAVLTVTTGVIYVDLGGTLALAGTTVNASQIYVQPVAGNPPVFNPGWPAPSVGYPAVRVRLLTPPPTTQHAVLQSTSGFANFVNATVQNTDTVRASSGTGLQINGTLNQTAGITDVQGTLTIPGGYSPTGGTVSVGGTLNAAGGLTLSGVSLVTSGTVNANIDVTGTVQVTTSGAFAGNVTVEAAGTLQFVGGYSLIMRINGNLTVYGTLNMRVGASDDVSDSIAVNNGSTTFGQFAVLNITAPDGHPASYADYEVITCQSINYGGLMINLPNTPTVWLYSFELANDYNPPTGGDTVPAGLILATWPYLL